MINNTDGVKLENISVSSETPAFNAKNSTNATVNGKVYDKIDGSGIKINL